MCRARRSPLGIAPVRLADLRLALRSLLRSPGYTAVVISILALGIGTCAALHSNLEGSLLRRYTFAEVDRLVRVEGLSQGNPYATWSFMARFLAYKERAKSISTIAGATNEPVTRVLEVIGVAPTTFKRKVGVGIAWLCK